MDKVLAYLLIIIGIIGVVCIVAVCLTLPTMWLWNWLMPELFKTPEIGFWQALGINLLSGLLFNRDALSRAFNTNSK